MRSGTVGDDSDDETADCFSAKADLCRETSAEVVVSWERNLSECLKHGALASRLISTDNNLRERQDTVQAAFANLGDSVEDASLLIGLQLLQGHRIGRDELQGGLVSR